MNTRVREERLGRRPASIHKNVAFQGEGIDEISRELLRMAGESSVRILVGRRDRTDDFVLEIRDGLFREDNA